MNLLHRKNTQVTIVLFINYQILALGLLHIAFVASKAVDQQADESQTSSVSIAQQRVGYDYQPPSALAVAPLTPAVYQPPTAPLASLDAHHDPHHHHHEEHDLGFWKKKVIWKDGWKKYWVSLN